MLVRKFVRRASAKSLRNKWQEATSAVNTEALMNTLDHDNHDERMRFWKSIQKDRV